jgi:hypothetical protein
MRRRLALGLLAAALFCPRAILAHASPNSVVRLKETPAGVEARVVIPLAELEPAFGRRLRPADVPRQRPALEAYIRKHMAIAGADGRPWPTTIERLGVGGTQDHWTLAVTIRFDRPRAAPARPFTFAYDAVNHEVMSHYALVYLDGAPLGRLQSPAGTLTAPARRL